MCTDILYLCLFVTIWVGFGMREYTSTIAEEDVSCGWIYLLQLVGYTFCHLLILTRARENYVFLLTDTTATGCFGHICETTA